jgi:hypothetical protein
MLRSFDWFKRMQSFVLLIVEKIYKCGKLKNQVIVDFSFEVISYTNNTLMRSNGHESTLMRSNEHK